MPGLLSGLFGAIFSKWLIIGVASAVAIGLCTVYKTGQKHAKLKIERDLTTNLKEGKAKVEKQIEKQKTKDTKILDNVKKIQDDSKKNGPLSKEEEFKQHNMILNELKDLGSYDK